MYCQSRLSKNNITMEQDIMQKLMKSKAIMDIHNNMSRVTDSTIINSNNPSIENFEAPSAKYNIPQEFMQEASIKATKTMESPSVDAIKNSKLPDEIKRIMMEHPITPQQNTTNKTILSDSLIAKANTLMGTGGQQKEQAVKAPTQSVSSSQIKQIVQETVRETIKEMGLLTESIEKSNEVFQFRVGLHLFEGKVTKIKKLKN